MQPVSVSAQINVCHDEFVQRHNRLLVGAEWGQKPWNLTHSLDRPSTEMPWSLLVRAGA